MGQQALWGSQLFFHSYILALSSLQRRTLTQSRYTKSQGMNLSLIRESPFTEQEINFFQINVIKFYWTLIISLIMQWRIKRSKITCFQPAFQRPVFLGLHIKHLKNKMMFYNEVHSFSHPALMGASSVPSHAETPGLPRSCPPCLQVALRLRSETVM